MIEGETNAAYLGYNDNLIYNSDCFCQNCTYEGTLGYDCNEVCNGPDQIACTGYCGDPSDNGFMANDCSYDPDNPDTHYGGSAQACGGVAAIDCNDECTGGGTGLVFAVEDCDDVCGGTAVEDCAENCSMLEGETNAAYLGYNVNLIYNSDGFCQHCTYEGTLGSDSYTDYRAHEQLCYIVCFLVLSDKYFLAIASPHYLDYPDTYYGG